MSAWLPARTWLRWWILQVIQSGRRWNMIYCGQQISSKNDKP